MYKKFQWTRLSLSRNALTRRYEPVQPFFFAALAKKLGADTILDVGANIGVYSIFSAADCPNATIQAFEPAPETFTELTANIRANGLQSRIAAHQLAVSDESTTVNFGIVGATSGANSIQSTSIHSEGKFASHQMVKARPLDSLIHATDKMVFIKVDVEGHENNVLRGAKKLLEQNRILLQIEDYSALDIDYLNDLGFERLLALGPDNYFTNYKSGFSEVLLLDALKIAIGSSIIDNRMPRNPLESPLDIPLAFGISLRITGKTALNLRKIKRSIKK